MIFYFTGTGNSYAIAKSLGDKIEEKYVLIDYKIMENGTFDLSSNETLGFVFPIYAWGVPQMVIDFIRLTTFRSDKKPYVFAVATCGENCGNAMVPLKRVLSEKNLNLDSVFSVLMPNNYIIFGNVDDLLVAKEKIEASKIQINQMAQIISDRQEGVEDVIKGPLPKILTNVFNPLFNNFGRSAKGFYAKENCSLCGLCEKICPSHNINVNGDVKWGSECTMCLACIHHCPERAIEYKKNTLNKGRYIHPDSLKTLF